MPTSPKNPSKNHPDTGRKNAQDTDDRTKKRGSSRDDDNSRSNKSSSRDR